jgi:cell shape-determining protein MreC
MVLFCIAILSLVLGFTGPHRKTSSATKTALQYAADQVKLAEQRPAEISAENSDDAIPTEYTAEWPRFLAKRDKIEDDYLLRRNNLAAEYPAFRSSLSDLGESGPPQKAIVASSRNIR